MTTPPDLAALALLPCPFCGSAPEIVQIGNEHTRSQGFEIRCLSFGCATKKRAMVIHHPLEKAREFAITAWNRRTTDITTLSRTAGRAEGLEAAAKVAERMFEAAGWHAFAKLAGSSIASEIRSLSAGMEICAEDFDRIVAMKDVRLPPSEALRVATEKYRIRALASDPAPGEQVAETARRGCAACYGACPSDPCPYDRAAPAHPTEPGEVERLGALHDWAIADHDRVVAELSAIKTEIERLRAIETAAREYRRMAWDQTPFELWADAGLVLDAALSTPRPKGEPIRHGSLCPFAISNGAPPFKCNCDYDLRVAIAQPKGATP